MKILQRFRMTPYLFLIVLFFAADGRSQTALAPGTGSFQYEADGPLVTGSGGSFPLEARQANWYASNVPPTGTTKGDLTVEIKLKDDQGKELPDKMWKFDFFYKDITLLTSAGTIRIPADIGLQIDATSIYPAGKPCAPLFGILAVFPAEVTQAGVVRKLDLSATNVTCDNAHKSTSFTLSFLASDTSGGGGGGGTPPPTPAPPPNVSFALPPELLEGPLQISNAQTSTFEVSTLLQPGFSGSDLTLSAISDADEGSAFDVSVSPSMISAPGAGNATVTIRTGPTTFPRDYHVVLIASSGEQQYFGTFTVSVICDPPLILGLDEPQNQTVVRGSAATLNVKAIGSGPFTYQWYAGPRGSTHFPVDNETSTKLSATDGMYWVRVSNACGSVDSNQVIVISK